MLLSTTSTIPDAEITQIIGVVHGSALISVKSGINDVGSTRDLNNQALASLTEDATELIADAVVEIKIDFCSDQHGAMCYATGTAVKLDRLPPWYLRQLQQASIGTENKFEDSADVPYDDDKPAVSIEAVTDPKELAIIDLMDNLSIDRHRCESLYDAGYTDLEKLKEADVADLKSVHGINPTIARTIKSKMENI